MSLSCCFALFCDLVALLNYLLPLHTLKMLLLQPKCNLFILSVIFFPFLVGLSK